jgi:hypothetical protein
MAIRVLNIKKDSLPKGYVYIGRPMEDYTGSPLHNSWRLRQYGNRAEVLAKYKRHLWEALKAPRDTDRKSIRLELFRLVRLAQQGDLNLACWRAPESCHGDVIKAAIEWIIVEDIHGYDTIK